eukprot:CAMPEP_0119520340 /NCGR_PEP_ID=MMETSP1344-20130328/36388_1 /TAXON_ID=236787 /ORGANISM="Florenciella parvula, Strain CCMP2471" /LENGTH=50 /DNA_ID=CAMNT_0007558217 /DNA_START=29 /DNA_END=181 /DNA_ORIENTATION=+
MTTKKLRKQTVAAMGDAASAMSKKESKVAFAAGLAKLKGATSTDESVTLA